MSETVMDGNRGNDQIVDHKDVTERRYDLIGVPEKIRSLVYLVGMLGFPVVAAAYTLVVLSSDLKDVDRRLSQLATRIDERPMGLDRTTDFIIYITESMRSDLKSGVYGLINRIDFTIPDSDEDIVKKLNIIDRAFEAYIRPIVRKHQRFSSRFPSVGGNIGSLFYLAAPAQDIKANHTEGYLTGQVNKDFGESLSAVIINNLSNFGDDRLSVAKSSNSKKEVEEMFKKIFEFDKKYSSEKTVDKEIKKRSESGYIIEKEKFVELTLGAIDATITALQDQMLQRVRVQSSDSSGGNLSERKL